MYEYTEVAPFKYALSIDNHEEIVSALLAFCKDNEIEFNVNEHSPFEE